ncbi:MAG: hypothetical protein COX62_00455 [Deltaproteobacteria bacterium CG_4_10_14_0_2_um_filter_43_8]|nr:MAG: hypothetical protein COV43_05865 [Deltaproteobacteria bacterium CG11_big_fil_rev_8_21_14_0_20_42_23]PJA22211.1 MAG: hypothetical protein COX62_00455 [Deltaproteobacteria bacterium CG_4_10_14_0_2_um_filter_43_8]PJC64492.1 MAG: hypothetical protein CO021_04005 [Deltaproteobacteria bacterium CG_4_9_14_0_2_um_filter_42_21]
MIPNPQFNNLPLSFWAHVRSLSQSLGYTIRGTGDVRTHSISQISEGMSRLGLATQHIIDENKKPSPLGQLLVDYFTFRADVLNTNVRNHLMDKTKAEEVFEGLKSTLNPKCPLPMNKQKGDKKKPAFLTGIVNILIEQHSQSCPVNYDPRQLTTIVLNNEPIRTMARRVDGAFPSAINPIAIWEIKEYYYTKTFGSRVADGVYETLLDGLELDELEKSERIKVLHYLFVDDYFTWWTCGKSYLCRLIDIMHMGYVDEIIFGQEVLERLPILVREWCVKNTLHKV